MNKLIILLILLCLSMLPACAVGNRYDYASSSVTFSEKSSGEIAVGVHDQRSYVINGSKTPDFVGVQRGGFYNPFDVRTKSKQPFSEDVSGIIIATLKNSGFQVTASPTNPSDSSRKTIETLISRGKEKALLVTITQWETDTFNNVGLLYNMSADVFDSKGNLIANNKVQGEDDLGGSFMNPPAHAMRASPVALSRKIEELLSGKKIRDALFNNKELTGSPTQGMN